MVTSLSNFSTRQDETALQNMDPWPVKGMRFYIFILGFLKTCFVPRELHWNFKFRKSAGKRDEKCVHEVGTKPIAGVSCPVYGHEVEPGVVNPQNLAWFMARFYERGDFGLESGTTFMDTCV